MCTHCAAICPQGAIHITGFPDEPKPLVGNHTLDPEELLLAIESRRSIRHFKSQPVEHEKLSRIIEAGRFTPTAENAQNVSYLILEENIADIEKAAVTFFQPLKKAMDFFSSHYRTIEIDDHFFFKGAPTAIVILSPNKVDGGLAASNMELMAQAQGLGVLYSGFFTIAANHCRTVRKISGFTPNEKAVATLVIGYSAVKYQRTAQKERPLVRMI